MKKIVICFLVLTIFLISGCGKKEQKPEISFSENYYQVFEPFKGSTSENYVVDNFTTRYDMMEVDKVLMNLSLSYFPANNSFYQGGQYLTREVLEKLLSKEELNKSEPIMIENKPINHNHVSYLLEQDYLSSNGNLKGISIALALNPYVSYETSTGVTDYQTLSKEEILQFGRQAANKLVTQIYKAKELQGVRIVIGLFVQASPDSMNKGTFEQIGVTTKSNITFTNLSYQEEYLTNAYVLNNDLANYNNFINLESSLKKQFTDLAISGKAIYVNGKTNDITIDINTVVKERGELMAISQAVAREISTLFKGEISVRVYVKFNKQIEAMILKEKNSTQANIYMMEG